MVATVVVFIAFTAQWCGPCKRLHKDFTSEQINFFDAEQDKELADSYEVTGFPTIIALVDGQEVARTVGYNNKQELLDWMERVRVRNP